MHDAQWTAIGYIGAACIAAAATVYVSRVARRVEGKMAHVADRVGNVEQSVGNVETTVTAASLLNGKGEKLYQVVTGIAARQDEQGLLLSRIGVKQDSHSELLANLQGRFDEHSTSHSHVVPLAVDAPAKRAPAKRTVRRG